MSQKPDCMPLTEADRDWLESAREWVKEHFTDNVEEKYAPVAGKLRVIDAILVNGWVASNETWKLQALGAAFGDALGQELLLDWVSVEDEIGATAALNWPGTSILTFPLTAISKRVERKEKVDVFVLFHEACANLRDIAFSGRIA